MAGLPRDPENLSKVSHANAEHSAVHAESAARIGALETAIAAGIPPANAAVINKMETEWKDMQAKFAAFAASVATMVGPVGPQGPQGATGNAGRSVVVTSGPTKPVSPGTGDVYVSPADAQGHIDVSVYSGTQWYSIDGHDGRDGRDGRDGVDGAVGPVGPRGPEGLPFSYQGQMPLGAGAPVLTASNLNAGHAYHEAGTRNLWISNGLTWLHWIDALPAGMKGDTGPKGDAGEDAYVLWKRLTGRFGASQADFIQDMKGDQGDPGPDGPKGDPGETLKVQGVVAGAPFLPKGPAPLTVLFSADTKRLWIYDPTSPLASLGTDAQGSPAGWVDCGEVSGPPGPPGARGQGVVQDVSQLPLNPRTGMSYFVLDTADVMRWDRVSGWYSIGQPGIGALRQLLERELSRFATGISHGEPVQTYGEKSPPAAARANEFFIVGDQPTGAWAGHQYELAWWTGRTLPDGSNEWKFAQPDKGDSHLVEKDPVGALSSYANAIITWSGTGWVKTGSLSAAALGSGSSVGMIAYFPKTAVPRGWLVCDGQTFDPATYPALNQFLGAARTPDLRDQFIRTWDATSVGTQAKAPGTTHNDTTRPPRNRIEAYASDSGSHHHSVQGKRYPSQHGSDQNDANPGGNMDYTFNTDAAGVHWHNIEFRSGWDAETAPKHIVLVAAICALDMGREGVQGPAGLQGPAGASVKGDKGDPGETLKISGVVATPAALPTSGVAHLDVRLSQSDGHLYINDPASPAAVDAATAAAPGYAGAPVGWVDMGKVQGPKGDTGEAGSLVIGTVTPLPSGATPVVTNTGDTKNAILDLGIPAGPIGVQGPSGPAGVQGLAGTVRVGTVTAAVGTTPTVVNSGTPEAAVLDFALVQGVKGDKGDKGDSGINGNTLTEVVGKGGVPPTTGTFTKGQLCVILK